MRTETGLATSRVTALRRAAATLRGGGLVAYPTEAVFGLGCDPWQWPAFERLVRLKGRALSKGVILIAADFGQLRPVLDPAYATLWAAARRSWPGPVTWVLPAHRQVPKWITGGRRTIAVRVTAHPVAAQLCRQFGGPLVSTSANRSGAAPLRDPRRVRLRLGRAVDRVIHGPLGDRDRPTEIRDGGTLAVIRAASPPAMAVRVRPASGRDEEP